MRYNDFCDQIDIIKRCLYYIYYKQKKGNIRYDILVVANKKHDNKLYISMLIILM
jgi:hypothetical protein